MKKSSEFSSKTDQLVRMVKETYFGGSLSSLECNSDEEDGGKKVFRYFCFFFSKKNYLGNCGC